MCAVVLFVAGASGCSVDLVVACVAGCMHSLQNLLLTETVDRRVVSRQQCMGCRTAPHTHSQLPVISVWSAMTACRAVACCAAQRRAEERRRAEEESAKRKREAAEVRWLCCGLCVPGGRERKDC